MEKCEGVCIVGRFCTNCGSELVEGSRFCSKCGSRADDDNVNIPNDVPPVQEKTSPVANVVTGNKQEIISELKRLHGYFAVKELQYNQRNSYINYLNTVKKPGFFSWLIVGGILSFIFYFLLYLITSIDIGWIGFRYFMALWGSYTLWLWGNPQKPKA